MRLLNTRKGSAAVRSGTHFCASRVPARDQTLTATATLQCFRTRNIFLDALVFDDWCFIGHAFGPPSATGICIETFLDFNVEKRMPDRPQRFGGSRKKRSAGARYF